MPTSHPGQDWKHGWIPLTAKAIRQKNHGKTPGADSKISQQANAAIRGMANRRRSQAQSPTETKDQETRRVNRMVDEDHERQRTDSTYAEYKQLRSQWQEAKQKSYDAAQKVTKARIAKPYDQAQVDKAKALADAAEIRMQELEDRMRDARKRSNEGRKAVK